MTYKPVTIKTEDDKRWAADRDKLGWTLPAPAAWWLRLPVIRKFRAVFIMIGMERHYAVWGAVGMARSGYDEWVLYAIARGWC